MRTKKTTDRLQRISDKIDEKGLKPLNLNPFRSKLSPTEIEDCIDVALENLSFKDEFDQSTWYPMHHAEKDLTRLGTALRNLRETKEMFKDVKVGPKGRTALTELNYTVDRIRESIEGLARVTGLKCRLTVKLSTYLESIRYDEPDFLK